MALRNYMYAKHLKILVSDTGTKSGTQIFKRAKPQPCAGCNKCHCSPQIDDLENLPQQLVNLNVKNKADKVVSETN